MEMITCTEASYGYDEGAVISGLNFTVHRGDYLCVVGENGSGKSTLIKGILTLKTPLKGEMKREPGLKAGDIGYLPQQTAIQKDFPAGVMEVVLSGRLSALGLRPFYNRRDREIALENLERLEIAQLRNECYRELSGGQQQRVLLARALCSARRLLVLDEPTEGLDPLVTHSFYSLIRDLNRQRGLTVIMVSHDIRSVLCQASHILHLGNRQLFFGSLPDYLETDLGMYFAGGGGDA